MMHDSNPGVTVSVPGQACDRQLRVTALGEITPSYHVFTLLFRRGAVAVLCVHGATSRDEARACASSVFPHVPYEVVDGDTTNGHVAPFHLWISALALSALSLREAQEQEEIRRLVRRIRMQIKENALRAWTSSEWREGQQKYIGHLRTVPAEVRAGWLEGVTETELSLMCKEIDAVIYVLTTMDLARFSEQEREAHLREAKAIEDALDLEEMRRLITKVQISLSHQEPRDGEAAP